VFVVAESRSPTEEDAIRAANDELAPVPLSDRLAVPLAVSEGIGVKESLLLFVSGFFAVAFSVGDRGQNIHPTAAIAMIIETLAIANWIFRFSRITLALPNNDSSDISSCPRSGFGPSIPCIGQFAYELKCIDNNRAQFKASYNRTNVMQCPLPLGWA
jgi:hypothetical protein